MRPFAQGSAHRSDERGARQKHGPGKLQEEPERDRSPGSTEETATFIPIGPDKLAVGMAKWERYLHSDQPDPLVQLALVHAEFEALHPFTDGNGRLGRMLIPLFLYERQIINQPDFYISEYLERHREAYYEGLLAVSRDDNWTGWCVFFLKALSSQAVENTRKARSIMELYEEIKVWIGAKVRSRYGVSAIDYLFRKLIFRVSHFVNSQDIPSPSARRILNMIRDDLLLELLPASGRRSAVYAFPRLLDIVEGMNVDR